MHSSTRSQGRRSTITCWKNRGDRVNEIIEIGAVAIDEFGEEIASFQSFVKPQLNPTLSEFCIELTSIQQTDVDAASSFFDVHQVFVEWIHEYAGSVYRIWSWGNYDRKQFESDCKIHHLSTEWLDGRHFNLKADFARHRKAKQVGMSRALKICKLELIGTHHRGIDDARNIGRIFVIDMDWYLQHARLTNPP